MSISRRVEYFRRTAGTQSFQSGFATFTCDKSVFANVLYAFYSASGVKLSEATVFSAAPSIQSRLILDHRDGARLGVAIANITDIARTYTITLTEGPNVKTTSITVPAQRSQAASGSKRPVRRRSRSKPRRV